MPAMVERKMETKRVWQVSSRQRKNQKHVSEGQPMPRC